MNERKSRDQRVTSDRHNTRGKRSTESSSQGPTGTLNAERFFYVPFATTNDDPEPDSRFKVVRTRQEQGIHQGQDLRPVWTRNIIEETEKGYRRSSRVRQTKIENEHSVTSKGDNHDHTKDIGEARRDIYHPGKTPRTANNPFSDGNIMEANYSKKKPDNVLRAPPTVPQFPGNTLFENHYKPQTEDIITDEPVINMTPQSVPRRVVTIAIFALVFLYFALLVKKNFAHLFVKRGPTLIQQIINFLSI